MQIADNRDIEKRILYYISKMYSKNLKQAQDYSKLTKCIGIVFIDYELDKLKKVSKYITKWNLREKEYRKIVLTDAIELYIIELRKVPKYAEDSKLDTWVKFITNSEDIDMNRVDEEIKQAQKVLEDVNKDEYEQYLAELREKYVIEMNTMKSAGYEKGKEDGKLEGIREIVEKMKEKMDIQSIINITGLSKEEIEKL